jgi:hypothetical protein
MSLPSPRRPHHQAVLWRACAGAGRAAGSWSAHLIGGKKMKLLGFVEAATEMVLFSLDSERPKRLTVNPLHGLLCCVTVV